MIERVSDIYTMRFEKGVCVIAQCFAGNQEEDRQCTGS